LGARSGEEEKRLFDIDLALQEKATELDSLQLEQAWALREEAQVRLDSLYELWMGSSTESE
jgi:hypothetical protein